jgi:hypothetical protein
MKRKNLGPGSFHDINYDFESRMSFDSIKSSQLQSIRERILQAKEVNIAKKMQKVIDFTKNK